MLDSVNWPQTLVFFVLEALLLLAAVVFQRVLSRRSGIKAVHHLGLQPLRLASCGAILALTVLVAARMIGAFVAVQLPVSQLPAEPHVVFENAMIVSSYMILICGVPFFFLVGSWMGRHSMHMAPARGSLNVLSASIVAAVGALALSLSVLGLMQSVPSLGHPDVLSQIPDSSLTNLLASIWQNALLMFVPMLAGFVYGRRRLNGAYLRYLLRRVPRSTADTIVGLAYEEAAKSDEHVRSRAT